MNDFNDIDRELQAAFTQRPTVLSRPSLRDVKQRARRHQRQRSAGVLGACALVGVGGVAALATRSPANETAVGVGEGDPSSTICYPTDSTFPAISFPAINDTSTVPLAAGQTTINTVTPTTIGVWFYIVQPGDNPTSVAQQHGVTLEALNAANVNTPGYDIWFEGLEIVIPTQLDLMTETTAMHTDGGASATTAFAPGVSNTSTPIVDPGCLPTTSSTFPGDSTTTTSIPNFTKVSTSIQVANCSNQEGAAGYLSSALAEEGFTLVEPDTCTIDLPLTKVIYNPDDPLAFSVALTVSVYLNNAVVEPSGPVVPTLTLGTWAYGSGVLVLLGDELAGKTLAQIAADGIATTDTTVPHETSATVTTCIKQPQMTLPLPATSTTMPGIQYC